MLFQVSWHRTSISQFIADADSFAGTHFPVAFIDESHKMTTSYHHTNQSSSRYRDQLLEIMSILFAIKCYNFLSVVPLELLTIDGHNDNRRYITLAALSDTSSFDFSSNLSFFCISSIFNSAWRNFDRPAREVVRTPWRQIPNVVVSSPVNHLSTFR